MAGGYGEDRLVQGGSDSGFYVLRHWACLDTFVYFSHHLVTIPPPGWIDAAHTHGVRVLGTLITEWEAGAAACAELFGSPEAAADAAEALARIAACYGFEGWLINIENEVPPGHIPNLLHFLRVLTQRMREVAPGWSQVVWYDAVTTDGKLQWQNALTPLNRPFFDACDGLWVNYTWQEDTPAVVKQEAGERAADVFMGVDCFGRGTFAGGGFSCGAALRASLEQGLSAALFAVGWPYEGDCGPDAPACWRQRDDRFWAGIEQAWRRGLPTCRGACAAGTASSALPGPRLQLPLYSNFCGGSGRALFRAGRQLSAQPWYNLSLQAPQPLLAVKLQSGISGSGNGSDSVTTDLGAGSSSVCSDEDAGQVHCPVRAALCEERAYSGSSSVRVHGSLRPGERATVQLFEPAVELPAEGVSVRLTASLAGSVGLRLALRLAPAGSTPAGEAVPAGSSSGAKQHDSAAMIVLNPLFSAAAGKAAAADAAQALDAALATDSPGGPPQVELSASAISQVAAHAVPTGGVSITNDSGVPAEPDWQTFLFSLGPELLSGAGSSVWLAAMDVLLEGGSADSAQGSSSSSSSSSSSNSVDLSSFQVDLGELCIEPSMAGCAPALPDSVSDLVCKGLQLKRNAGTTDSKDGGGGMLAAWLQWQAPASGVRCCHVWYAFDGCAAGAAAAEACWLGVACADALYVSGLAAPARVAAVTFWVQPEGRNGLVQELAAAMRVRFGLEGKAWAVSSLRSGFGEQPLSNRSSAPAAGFGSSSRDAFAKQYASAEVDRAQARARGNIDNPLGACYSVPDTISKQVLSTVARPPGVHFGTSKRPGMAEKSVAPGPGAYRLKPVM
ncbi:hypothetical protein ABPG77_005668, partial [Micractinium sp. CCAP 211/92]